MGMGIGLRLVPLWSEVGVRQGLQPQPLAMQQGTLEQPDSLGLLPSAKQEPLQGWWRGGPQAWADVHSVGTHVPSRPGAAPVAAGDLHPVSHLGKWL